MYLSVVSSILYPLAINTMTPNCAVTIKPCTHQWLYLILGISQISKFFTPAIDGNKRRKKIPGAQNSLLGLYKKLHPPPPQIQLIFIYSMNTKQNERAYLAKWLSL